MPSSPRCNMRALSINRGSHRMPSISVFQRRGTVGEAMLRCFVHAALSPARTHRTVTGLAAEECTRYSPTKTGLFSRRGSHAQDLVGDRRSLHVGGMRRQQFAAVRPRGTFAYEC